MSYSDFTLSAATNDIQLTLNETTNLFALTPATQVSEKLQATLQNTAPAGNIAPAGSPSPTL